MTDKKMTAVGLDIGNTRSKVCIDNKCSSVPSIYAFDKPIVLGKSGQEIKAKAFSLKFKLSKDENDTILWFGQDVLASRDTIHKRKEAKYQSGHISILFRAALYQWSKQHKVDIASLGKLNIVTSMPPGLYQQRSLYNQALKAYRAAFNRGQRHVKIRDGKDTSVQIVSQFHSLVREAVVFGSEIPRKGQNVLVFDIGGETVDIALFNGSLEPAWSRSYYSGLLSIFSAIDPVNPGLAELKILGNKKVVPHALVSYYNKVENAVQTAKSKFDNANRQIDTIYLIGGGATLMPKSIRSTFTSLAKKVIFKDEYANARSNWKEASK